MLVSRLPLAGSELELDNNLAGRFGLTTFVPKPRNEFVYFVRFRKSILYSNKRKHLQPLT